MSKWPGKTFFDLYEEPSRNGLNRPRRIRGTGFKMVNMGEIFAYNRIKGQDMQLVPMNEREQRTYNLQKGDLLFARQSLVAEGAGKCSVILKTPELTTFESHLIRVRLDKNKANPLFYYYYFISPEGKANIQSLVMQVAAAGIRGSELKELSVPYPPLKVQSKIEFILSRYDDLIENNNSRTKILEQMAQTIYDEWFVKFRFPGHSKVKMVDSELGKIPKGWEVKSIMEVGHWDFINGNIKRYEGEKEYFATANIEGINIIKDGEWVEYATKPSRAQKEPIVYSVWFARMKDTYKLLGFTGANKDIAEKSILSSGFAGFKASEDVFPFLYYMVNSQKFHIVKDQFCTGATQMALTNDGLSRIKVIVPIESLIKQYSQGVSPLLDNIFVLQKKNKVLQQTRDILLPKLISGEIDVENMDIDIGDVDDR